MVLIYLGPFCKLHAVMDHRRPVISQYFGLNVKLWHCFHMYRNAHRWWLHAFHTCDASKEYAFKHQNLEACLLSSTFLESLSGSLPHKKIQEFDSLVFRSFCSYFNTINSLGLSLKQCLWQRVSSLLPVTTMLQVFPSKTEREAGNPLKHLLLHLGLTGIGLFHLLNLCEQVFFSIIGRD